MDLLNAILFKSDAISDRSLAQPPPTVDGWTSRHCGEEVIECDRNNQFHCVNRVLRVGRVIHRRPVNVT